MSTRLASMTSSVSSSLATFGRKPQRPDSRMAKAMPARAPVWPTVSIVLLLMFSVLLPAIALTVMNAALVTLALGVLLLTNQSIDKRLLYIAMPFVLMLLVGLASGVGAERYAYFKDAWYVGNPLLVMATGYILYRCKPDLGRGLRAFVIGGVIVGLWQLRPYVMQPDLITLPADTIRRLIGTGFFAPVVALVILILYAGQWRESLKIPSWLAGTIFIFAAVAVAGVFSRTFLLVVLIALAALLGCFAKREWWRLGLPLLAGAALAVTLQVFVDTESDRALKTYLGKLARSVHELTVSDYAGLRDINLSFRGHETARAFDQYMAGDVTRLLFGRGFGATVDLGVFLPLELNEAGGRVNVRYIGVLHNGYAYLLTKAGLAALLLYLFFLAYVYMLARPAAAGPWRQTQARTGRLLQACVVTFFATTYIVAGIFNKQDMFPFLLLMGYLIAALAKVDD
jgi:hypothetical protein